MIEVEKIQAPAGCCFTADHEWVVLDGDVYRIGITDYAQAQLGEVVFIEMPEVGAVFDKGEEFGSIESVKAVSELKLPLSGEIVEVNEELTDDPERVNKDPYINWIVAITPSNPEELSELMDESQYSEMTATP